MRRIAKRRSTARRVAVVVQRSVVEFSVAVYIGTFGPMFVVSPCGGESYAWFRPHQFPTETLPCRCGDPRCVIVEVIE